MFAPVLIAYSSRTGSTLEVAEAIAKVLRRTRLTVHVTRMRDVQSLDQFGSIILGTPIYVGELPREVHRFIARFRTPLAGLPSWMFVLGPVEGRPGEFGMSANQAGRELAQFPWFRPVEIKILGGRFDIDALPFPFNLGRRLLPSRFAGLPHTDLRNWSEINTWATLLSWRIKPVASRLAELEFAPEELLAG
ncbi:MAG TPA: flavodoxin domain-containing protein [Terracidiphilus sp.]|nr:flavodoxin domain-containing protein [Terracidiphilus sp.]